VQASPSILHPLQIKHSVAAGLSEQGQFAEKLKRTMETVCNKMAIEKFLSIQADFFQIFLVFFWWSKSYVSCAEIGNFVECQGEL
jgi:hypothetical protein